MLADEKGGICLIGFSPQLIPKTYKHLSTFWNALASNVVWQTRHTPPISHITLAPTPCTPVPRTLHSYPPTAYTSAPFIVLPLKSKTIFGKESTRRRKGG